MSNSLAIAAVTAALRARVFNRLGGPQVTIVPPDRAAEAVNGDHVNLFLYRADMHPSFRNADPPGSPPGETRSTNGSGTRRACTWCSPAGCPSGPTRWS